MIDNEYYQNVSQKLACENVYCINFVSRQGLVVSSYQHGNEPWYFTKTENFLTV
jgi:hypothetical protein